MLKKREVRKEMGLTEQFIDIKSFSKDPSLTFVEKPEIKTRSQLKEKRKEENLRELETSVKN